MDTPNDTIDLPLFPPDWRHAWCTYGKHWAIAESAGGGRWNYHQCPECRNAYLRDRAATDPEYLERKRQIARAHAQRKRQDPEYVERHRIAGAQYRQTPEGKAVRASNAATRRNRLGLCEHGVRCWKDGVLVMLSGNPACAVTGCANTDIEADHVMPAALGGLNCRLNMQPLCVRHNRQKGTMHPDDFLAHIGQV